MKDVTVATEFVRALLAGAQQQGLNYEPILLRHGISALALGNDDHRVPLEPFAAAALEIMAELDDELLGLTQQRQPLGTFAMMCRAAISARSIKRSIKRSANFWNLFNNTYHHQVFITGGRVIYELTPLAGQTALNNYYSESMLSTIHRFHCWMAGQFIPLNSVSMTIAEPNYSSEYRQLFYGAPIKFDQAFAQMEFDSRYAALDVVQTPETLDSYLAGTNLSVLYQAKHYRTLSDQLRQWIERNIKQQKTKITLRHAAEHFQLSQQVLHRRLQAEDTSFSEIKMQTRRDIAINLLFAEQSKIEEIASVVGFSEPSAFVRAFKVWTGSTPLNYRRANR